MKNSEVDMRVTCKAASCVGSNKNKKTTKLKSPDTVRSLLDNELILWSLSLFFQIPKRMLEWIVAKTMTPLVWNKSKLTSCVLIDLLQSSISTHVTSPLKNQFKFSVELIWSSGYKKTHKIRKYTL